MPLWAGISHEQQERVVETVRAAVGVRVPRVRTPINRHRLPQLAADLAIILAAWFLAFRLRFDPDLPRYYEYYLELGGPRARRGAEAGRVRAVRLLQPLVALRLDARHVGCCARCHGRLAPHLPRLHALRHPRGARAALGLGDRLAADARARRGVADARADDHRAAADELDRGARQGGDRRRGRRRGPADAPRDAAHARARLHADRADRRRPAQEEPAAARHPRARHERRAPPHPPRPPAGRAPDRDPVRLRRGARSGSSRSRAARASR